MQRPNDQEFLSEVLRELPDLPEGLAEQFLELVGLPQDPPPIGSLSQEKEIRPPFHCHCR